MLTWKGITKKFLSLYVIQLVSLMNVFLWYFQMLEVPNKNVYVVNTFDRLFEKLSLTVSLVYLLMKQLKAFCHNIFMYLASLRLEWKYAYLQIWASKMTVLEPFFLM